MSNIETVEAIELRRKQMLERMAEQTKALRTTGAYITFKNAVLKVDGQPVPNNVAEVRVLSAISERAWYDGPYDADNAQVPACYALDDTVPHPEARDPQSDSCETCPKNKWGTAPPRPGSQVPGKGKACRESARLVVIAARIPLKSAPLYLAKIPVTSLQTVTTFMNRCIAAQKLPGEFVAELSVAEDKRSFFKVSLTMKEHTADLDPNLLLERQTEAEQLALQPYPNLE